MHVKRDVGKDMLHKLPIYNEYIIMLVLSLHIFGMIFCLFKGFDPNI